MVWTISFKNIFLIFFWDFFVWFGISSWVLGFLPKMFDSSLWSSPISSFWPIQIWQTPFILPWVFVGNGHPSQSVGLLEGWRCRFRDDVNSFAQKSSILWWWWCFSKGSSYFWILEDKYIYVLFRIFGRFARQVIKCCWDLIVLKDPMQVTLVKVADLIYIANFISTTDLISATDFTDFARSASAFFTRTSSSSLKAVCREVNACRV